jgi:hypothetical protein
MKKELNNLKTIKNFALSKGWTASYIYKMIGENKVNSDALIIIDGVKFIDITKFTK